MTDNNPKSKCIPEFRDQEVNRRNGQRTLVDLKEEAHGPTYMQRVEIIGHRGVAQITGPT